MAYFRDEEARSIIRESYGRVRSDSAAVAEAFYTQEDLAGLPREAVELALGVGHPLRAAKPRPGETVLDLGCGAGIDTLLAAKAVAPSGKAIGLDMTPEMAARARRNAEAAGLANVEILDALIEQIPLPDASVDVVISNCVINLSTDKARVLREAFRVLRPGGRFAVSDILVQGELPEAVRRSLESWAGCVAGALEEGDYRRLLGEAGFRDVEINVTRAHDAPAEGQIFSVFVRARKP